MTTQTDRLLALLRQGRPVRTDEIVRVVYGEGLSLSRVAARIYDAKKKLPPGWTIEGRKDREHPALYWYSLVKSVDSQLRFA